MDATFAVLQMTPYKKSLIIMFPIIHINH